MGGNTLWSDPEIAKGVGAQILGQLCERYGFKDQRRAGPGMSPHAASIMADALEAVNYAGLPTERRAHILCGLIGVAAEAGLLGGEPEWSPVGGQDVREQTP